MISLNGTGGVMRIATWNLQSDKAITPERRDAFRKSMADVNADVWVLTETWTDFSPGDQFQLAAETMAASDLTKWPNRRWTAIWARSRYSVEAIAVEKQPDRMACGLLKVSGKRDMVVIGTVLPWHFDPLWLYSKGFCAAFDLQESELSRLRKNHDECDFVFSGDFNQSFPCQDRCGSKIGEMALRRAFEKHGLTCLSEGPDSLTGKPRIDHICVNRQNLTRTTVTSWPIPQINGKDITDHPGVFADVEFT